MNFSWDQHSSDDLSVMLRKLTDVTESTGWQQIMVLWGRQIEVELKALLRQPSPHATADDYALKAADRAGFVRALQEAQSTPYDVIKSVQGELQRRQYAAEQAEPSK